MLLTFFGTACASTEVPLLSDTAGLAGVAMYYAADAVDFVITILFDEGVPTL